MSGWYSQKERKEGKARRILTLSLEPYCTTRVTFLTATVSSFESTPTSDATYNSDPGFVNDHRFNVATRMKSLVPRTAALRRFSKTSRTTKIK